MDFTSEEYFRLNEKLVNDLISVENLLVVISEKLYSIGLLSIKNGSKRRKLRYNPIIIFCVSIIFVIREVLSLLLNDRNISLMLGDFAFNWRLKSIWNLGLIIIFCISLVISVNHLISRRSTHYPFALGHIHLTPTLKRKQKAFINYLDFVFKASPPSTYMPLSLLNYYLKSTTMQMLIFGMPWTIYGGMATFYIIQFIFWQLFYFYLMALKIRLQLKLENNRLNYLRIKLSNRLLAQNLVKSLSKFNEIHSNITKTNKFWSTYIFAMCFGYGWMDVLDIHRKSIR